MSEQAYWKKLLQIAQSVDSCSQNPPRTLSDEDRKFIEEAISSAICVDPVRIMQQEIAKLRVLNEPTDEDADALAKIVYTLEEIVCQIDYAFDFCKLGGLEEVLRLLRSGANSVRWELLKLIPSLCQNNPRVQDIALRGDLLEQLFVILNDTNEKEEIRITAASGISAIVRAHEKALSRFVDLEGRKTMTNVFQTALENGQTKLANKLAFVMTSIAWSLGEDAKKSGVVEYIARLATELSSDDSAFSYVLDYVAKNACFSAGAAHLKPELCFCKTSKRERETLRAALKHHLENEEWEGNKAAEELARERLEELERGD